MCSGATAAHLTATDKGCGNYQACWCWWPAAERGHHHLSHQGGTSWRDAGGEEGYKQGSRQRVSCGLLQCKGALAGVLVWTHFACGWVIVQLSLWEKCDGQMVVRRGDGSQAWRGGGKLVVVRGFSCEWALLFSRVAMQGCEKVLCVLVSHSWAWDRVWVLCGAQTWGSPGNGGCTSLLWYQQYVGCRSTLSWLKLTDLNQGQKCCLLERFLKLLVCWWLCEVLDKRRVVFFWRCDKPRQYLLHFMLALSARNYFWW